MVLFILNKYMNNTYFIQYNTKIYKHNTIQFTHRRTSLTIERYIYIYIINILIIIMDETLLQDAIPFVLYNDKTNMSLMV